MSRKKTKVIVHYLMLFSFFFPFTLKREGENDRECRLSQHKAGEGVYINYLLRLSLYNPNGTNLGARSFYYLYILKEDEHKQ